MAGVKFVSGLISNLFMEIDAVLPVTKSHSPNELWLFDGYDTGGQL